MPAAEDPNVVLVFVDETDTDAEGGGAISGDDLHAWLSIVGPVEYVKLQFEVTSGRPCFSVRFQRADAARLTVEHLSGVKLKNCVVSIRSRIFTTPSSTVSGDAASVGAGAGAVAQSPPPMKPSNALPHNHLMPADIRLDGELAEFLDRCALAEVSAAEGGPYADLPILLASLQSTQQAVAAAMDAIQAARVEVERTDAAILALRAGGADGKSRSQGLPAHSVENAAAASGDAGRGGGGSDKLKSKRSTTIRSCNLIPTAQCGPAQLVSLITEQFGPILWCHCLLDTSGDENRFSLSFAFMIAEDADYFLASVSDGSVARGKLKRRKMDGGSSMEAAVGGDAETALYRTTWELQSA